MKAAGFKTTPWDNLGGINRRGKALYIPISLVYPCQPTTARRKKKINIAAYKQESIRRKSVHRNVLRRDSDAGVKRQNIAKWPPRRHGGYLAKDRGFADADQKLRHSCPSGQGADEVTTGL